MSDHINVEVHLELDEAHMIRTVVIKLHRQGKSLVKMTMRSGAILPLYSSQNDILSSLNR